MPLYDYKCLACDHRQEHFVYPNANSSKRCPICQSNDYIRKVSLFKNIAEPDNDTIDKQVGEIYSQIGKESLEGDTKTLDNVFGEDKVNRTFSDDVEDDY